MSQPTNKRVYRRQEPRPQQVTRIPPCRPGTWVRVREKPGAPAESVYGKIWLVRTLSCSITHPDQKRALWRVSFEDGRSVPVSDVVEIFLEKPNAERSRV